MIAVEPAGLRFETVQTLVSGGDPNGALPVTEDLVWSAHQPAFFLAGWVTEKFIFLSVVTAKTTVGNDPKSVLLVFNQFGNVVADDGVWVEGFGTKNLKLITVELEEAVGGRDPDETEPILDNMPNRSHGDAVFFSDTVDVEPAPEGIGFGDRCEPGGDGKDEDCADPFQSCLPDGRN